VVAVGMGMGGDDGFGGEVHVSMMGTIDDSEMLARDHMMEMQHTTNDERRTTV